MPFERLSERINMAIRRATGRGRLNEQDVDEMMKEIRISLLEADVNYIVVRDFIAKTKEKALGEKILKSVTPSDMVVKLVHDELKELMGEASTPIKYKMFGYSVFMLVGLNGAGKTTHVGKIAEFLRKKDAKKPLLIAADIYRPAAIDQLKKIGNQLNIEVFSDNIKLGVLRIIENGLAYANSNKFDLVIIDTAGRQHVNQELMDELVQIENKFHPDETLLVIDAMTGQDAINVITAFNTKLKITGCILTKLDGDTKGGVALSVRYLTKIPIKYIGVGEKLDQLEVFHPDRMADRILGMGDIVSFVEKIEDQIEEKEAEELAAKFGSGEFDYNDFFAQIKKIKKIGSMKGLLGLIPGIGKQIREMDIDVKRFDEMQALYNSMTKEERKNPRLIASSTSRKERISRGSGRPYIEINNLVRRFDQMKSQMKQISAMGDNVDPSKLTQMSQTKPMKKRTFKI